MFDDVVRILRAKRKFVVVLLVGLILILVLRPLWILPGFEGINSGLEGVEIGGKFYRVDTPNPQMPSGPPVYWWGNQDPRDAMLYKDADGWGVAGHGAVRVETQTPRIVTDVFTQPKEVDYWVKQSDTNFIHIKGQVNMYNFEETISAHNTGHIHQSWFIGEKLWFSLTTVLWDQAYQEQSPYTGNTGYGQAWEAPLAVIIEKYQVKDAGDAGILDPSEVGRWITLYDQPRQAGVISDLGVKGANVNTTLAGDPSPDSRLRQTAYFAITLTKFGVSEYIGGLTAPVVDITFKLYSIQIGKYTYTNPDDTPWGEREPESWDPLGLGKMWRWLTKPFGAIFGFAISTLMLVVIIVATGVILGSFTGRRKRE